MRRRLFFFTVVGFGLITALSGCNGRDPEVTLARSINELETAIQSKDASHATDFLHDQFTAQSTNNREWAWQTMKASFMMYQNVNVTVLNRRTTIDAHNKTRATVEADVFLAGIESTFPDKMGLYHVSSEWRRDGNQWKMITLKWEQ